MEKHRFANLRLVAIAIVVLVLGTLIGYGLGSVYITKVHTLTLTITQLATETVTTSIPVVTPTTIFVERAVTTTTTIHKTTTLVLEKTVEKIITYTHAIPTPMEPVIKIISYPTEPVELYSKIEVVFNITELGFSNPFNSSDIDVYGYIVTPSSRLVKFPAFYTRLHQYDPGYVLVKWVSQPLWVLRFTPTEVGVYRIRIEARDSRGLRAVSNEIEISVTPCRTKCRGFLRLDKSKGLLVFDDGSSEILIGLNLAWPPNKAEAVEFYRSWFKKLRDAGVRAVRIGLVPWALNLEWDHLHRYSLSDAARLDEIVRLAEENGIYIILVFMWHDELADSWGSNPYNVARGGPIKSPEEFWSNPTAIRIFKDKVRYIVARWGYSPNILAWELVNEADLTAGFSGSRDAFINWVKEVGSYIRSLDPYGRPITVSLADYTSEPRLWELDVVDIVNVHRYGPVGFKDIATAIPSIVEFAWSRYRKPVVITEFGVDYRWIGMPGFAGTPYWAYDREGVGLHEGLWSSALSGVPITAMSWWWDVQIERYNLFYHFKSLSEFLRGVDPARGSLRKINVVVESAKTDRDSEITSITLYPLADWIRTPLTRHNLYVVRTDGLIEGELHLLSGFIYGRAHPQSVLNPVFNVTLLDRGKAVIRVNSVGKGSAVLVVFVDDKKVLEVPLPDKDGRGDGVANEYGEEFVLELEPGAHRVRITNEGVDWLAWDFIRFENAVYTKAKVQALGFGNKTFALIWVRNRDHNWWNKVASNNTIEVLRSVVLRVENLEDGVYRAEYWDTYTGRVIETKEIEVAGGIAKIYVSSLGDRDIAIKMYRIGS